MSEETCPWCDQEIDEHFEREPATCVRAVVVQSCADGTMRMLVSYIDEPIENGRSALGFADRMTIAKWIENTINAALEPTP